MHFIMVFVLLPPRSLVELVLYLVMPRLKGSWRHPIDLITILENGFKELPVALDKGKRLRVLKQQQQKTEDNDNHKDKKPKQRWGIDNPGMDAFVAMLLGDRSIQNRSLVHY